jgi:hypothetical protein
MTVFGLPLGSALALAGVVLLPLLTHGLYRIDRARAGGYVTVFGARSSDMEQA